MKTYLIITLLFVYSFSVQSYELDTQDSLVKLSQRAITKPLVRSILEGRTITLIKVKNEMRSTSLWFSPCYVGDTYTFDKSDKITFVRSADDSYCRLHDYQDDFYMSLNTYLKANNLLGDSSIWFLENFSDDVVSISLGADYNNQLWSDILSISQKRLVLGAAPFHVTFEFEIK
jgi:hypothetical protein